MRHKRLRNGYRPIVNVFNLCIIKDKVWKTKVGKGKGRREKQSKQEGSMNYTFILLRGNYQYQDMLFIIEGKRKV